jgi:hypothetical protein
LGAAVHDAGRLAAYECRPAMAGLPGRGEYHPDHRRHAQPRVTTIAQRQRGKGSQTATRSGGGQDVRVTRTAHSTHHQADIRALPVWSSVFAVLT